MGLIATLISSIRIAVLPWAGGALKWLAPLAVYLPGLSGISHWFRVAAYLSLLALGVWGGVHVNRWWTGDMVTQAEADASAKIAAEAALERARMAAERAQIDAEKKALESKQSAIATRELAVGQLESQQQQFEQALEAERNASTHGDDVAVIDADDPWLRAWQRRGR